MIVRRIAARADEVPQVRMRFGGAKLERRAAGHRSLRRCRSFEEFRQAAVDNGLLARERSNRNGSLFCSCQCHVHVFAVGTCRKRIENLLSMRGQVASGSVLKSFCSSSWSRS
jgi:hypothetical protein